ncbi:MAG: segregation and condensation protein A, partial [Chitinophagales bacterium]
MSDTADNSSNQLPIDPLEKLAAEASEQTTAEHDQPDYQEQIVSRLEMARQAMGAQQEEMPFAIVRGEAVTVLPKDLYIPPEALEVFLDTFEGPLDLLLYLIKRQNIDILEI